MTTLLFANQAQTTLAAPVSNTATTIYVAGGTAAYFPNPSVDEAFKLTLVSAVNNLIEEVVLVTAVNGDAMTVIRGQEGTVPRAWKVGDFAANLMTAGTGNAFAQIYGLENKKYSASFINMATDAGTVLAMPTQANDLANKLYVDSVSQGKYKNECLCATTEDILLYGLQEIDGITLVAGDRVLVKNQAQPQYNGIYVASATAWARAFDMNIWAQVAGALTFVISGTVNALTGWASIAPDTGTINVTPIIWTQISGVGTYTAGTGLQLIGTQFSIANTGVNAASYGNSNSVPTIAVNAQGQITSASNTTISISPNQINAPIPNSSLAYSSVKIGSTTVSLGDTLTSLAGVTISGASNTLTFIPNSALDNSSITLNGVNIALGGSATITAVAPNALTIGTGLDGTSYNGSVPVTIKLADTTVTSGAYGSASKTLEATVNAQGQLTALAAVDIAIANTQVSGLGTMSTQNANAVAITGGTMSAVSISLGSIDNTPIGATTANTIRGTTITATTGFTGSGANLTSIPNGALVNSSVTYNGVNVALGSSGTITAVSPYALAIGTGLNGGSYDGSAAVTVALANTAVVAGTYGTDARSMTLTVNAQGQITSLYDQPISIAASQINTTIPNSGLTNSTISGVSLGSNLFSLTIGTGLNGSSYNGSGAVTIALANTTVTAGSYGSASKSLSATVNAQGQLTSLSAQNIAIATAQITDAGQPFGAATLDASGTLTASQIPASLLGALRYQGTWNALANTPTLTSSVGTQGYYYVVNVAGTTNLNGITDWQIGDWAIYNGTVWQKIDNTEQVTSVNGYTGAVVLTYTDVGAASSAITISAGTGLSGGGNLTANRTLSIANTGVTAASYGAANQTLQATVNAQGQLTSLSAVSIAIATSQITSGILSGAYGGTGVNNGTNTLTLSGSYTLNQSVASGASPTFTGTNFSAIPNSALSNSTISGVALGGNLFNLTAGTNVTFSSGTTYNGSAAITINAASTMVYPGAGIPNSTGSAWGTSYSTTGTGTVVVLQQSPTISSPLIDGASPWIDFGNGNTVTLAAGRMWYSPNTGAWNLGMGGGNITQQIGEELFVYGKASAAITDSPLQIIYHTGTVGSSGVIKFAPTIAGITDENAIIGVATEPIALNGFGRITSFGVIHGINTSGSAFGETWADDDVIWYNPVTGNPTNIKPIAPNIKFQVGLVISAGSGGSGSFQVLLQPGSKLGGTDSNVQINGSLATNNLLQYNGTYWTNVAPSAITGIGSLANSLTIGTGLTGTSYNGATAVTIAIDSTVATLAGIQTFTNKSISGSTNTLTNIPNSALVNSAITIGSSSVSLGNTLSTLAGVNISGSANTITNIGNSSLVNSSVTIGSSSLSLGGTLSTFAGVTISGATNTLTNIGNGSLTNSSITINGNLVSLGGSTTVTAIAPNALTIGTGLSGTSYNGSAAVTIANTGVLSFSGGTTGLTPSTATTGAITLAGTLALANGGTGATTVAAAQTNLQVDPAGTAVAMAIALG